MCLFFCLIEDSILRYDVWLVDWRTSCDLPWTVYQDYTLDDCAAYDYPAAIDKVLEITKQVRFSFSFFFFFFLHFLFVVPIGKNGLHYNG